MRSRTPLGHGVVDVHRCVQDDYTSSPPPHTSHMAQRPIPHCMLHTVPLPRIPRPSTAHLPASLVPPPRHPLCDRDLCSSIRLDGPLTQRLQLGTM